MRTNFWNETDLDNQLRPELDKVEFDTLTGYDFLWFILEPIDLANDPYKIRDLTKRFSSIQKTLYFYWFLDAEVTNGGLIQFYWNGKEFYLPPIIEGLKVINDTAMIQLLLEVDEYYLKILSEFKEFKSNDDDFRGAIDRFTKFEDFTDTFFDIYKNTHEMIESYARQHPELVCTFK